MTKSFKSTYPDITHTWYSDNAGALGTFDHLENFFKSLKRNGPALRYLPNPTKSILVMHPQNLKAGDEFGRRHGFKVRTGGNYLGSYIGDDKTKGYWIKECAEKWEIDIYALRKTANKYPQESYSAVDHAVQSEWIFLQHVSKYTGQAFTGLKMFCGKTFYLYFLRKIYPPPNNSRSKYVYGKEIRNGLTESCESSTGQIHHITMFK